MALKQIGANQSIDEFFAAAYEILNSGWAGVFNQSYIVGNAAAPAVGTVTLDFTNALQGATVFIQHQDTAVPAFLSNAAIVPYGAFNYIPNTLNYILLQYYTGNIVLATIWQANPKPRGTGGRVWVDYFVDNTARAFQFQNGGTTGNFTILTTPVVGKYGLVQMTTGANATGREASRTQLNQFLLGQNEFQCSVENLVLSAVSGAVDRYVATHLLTNSDTSLANCCGIHYSDTVGANWFGICANAGVTTTLDLGVAVAAATDYDLDFIVNRAATSVEFFVNGISRGSIATNIPTTSLGFAVGIRSVLSVTPKLLDMDTQRLYIPF